MSASSKPSLQRLFDELNALHFDGKLPRYRARRQPVPADVFQLRHLAVTVHAVKRIRIVSSVTGEGLRPTMLHEMCHVACPAGPRIHGPCFMACLRRLAETEPLLASEIEWYDERRPVPGHPPGISRAGALAGAIHDLARDGRPRRWSAVRRTLAGRLDLYSEAVLDDEFPDARAAWLRAVARERDRRRLLSGGPDRGVPR